MNIIFLVIGVWNLLWAGLWLYGLLENKKVLKVLGWITAVLLLIQSFGILAMAFIAS